MKRLFLLFVFLLVVPVVVYAKSDGADITLNLSPGSIHDTAYYNFNFPYQYASIDIDDIKNSAYEQKIIIALRKKNLLSTKQVAVKQFNATYHTRLHAKMGKHGSGNYSFGFGARNNAYGMNVSSIVNYAGVVSSCTTLRSDHVG